LLKVALKGLGARKLRTALTGFAVVIGVAFVAGTFVFTDTIDASFKDLFERTQKGTDVSVQARLAVEEDFAQPPTMASDTLARVQSVPGVEEAFGSVSNDVTLLDRKGDPILSNGPPTIGITAPPKRFDPFDYKEGGPPQNDNEVAIDKATADKYDFHKGDTVTVQGQAPAKQYTVSGVATLGASENLAGSRLVVFTLPEAQRVTGHDGYDDISVAAKGGTSPEQLKAAMDHIPPNSWAAVLGLLLGACLDVFSGFVCARVAQRDEWRVGGTLATISALCTLMLSDGGDAADDLTLLLTLCTAACTLLGVKYGRELNQRPVEVVTE